MPKAPIHPFILLCLLAVPLPNLQGQEALKVRVIPRFGLLSPDTYFYEKFVNFADDEPEEWTNGSLGRAAYAAVALEAGLEDRGIFLRGEVGRSFEGWLLVRHNFVRPRIFFEPKEIITTWLDVPAALTFATAQIILPTRLEAWGVQPYFFVGGGGKWYHFGEPTEENTVEAILPSNGFTANLDVGGGFAFTLWGQDLDIQIRDTFNRYWGKYQHDLILSGAWAWTIR